MASFQCEECKRCEKRLSQSSLSTQTSEKKVCLYFKLIFVSLQYSVTIQKPLPWGGTRADKAAQEIEPNFTKRQVFPPLYKGFINHESLELYIYKYFFSRLSNLVFLLILRFPFPQCQLFGISWPTSKFKIP